MQEYTHAFREKTSSALTNTFPLAQSLEGNQQELMQVTQSPILILYKKRILQSLITTWYLSGTRKKSHSQQGMTPPTMRMRLLPKRWRSSLLRKPIPSFWWWPFHSNKILTTFLQKVVNFVVVPATQEAWRKRILPQLAALHDHDTTLSVSSYNIYITNYEASLTQPWSLVESQSTVVQTFPRPLFK